MVEEGLDEVFLANDILDELFRSLDQPEGEDLVQVASKSWVQIADLLFEVWIRHVVERDQFVHEQMHALLLLLVLAQQPCFALETFPWRNGLVEK